MSAFGGLPVPAALKEQAENLLNDVATMRAALGRLVVGEQATRQAVEAIGAKVDRLQEDLSAVLAAVKQSQGL
jgi:hypothetical protein